MSWVDNKSETNVFVVVFLAYQCLCCRVETTIHTYAIGKVPSFLEPLSHLLPKIPGWLWHVLLHEVGPDDVADLLDDLCYGGLAHTIAVGNCQKGVPSRKESSENKKRVKKKTIQMAGMNIPILVFFN